MLHSKLKKFFYSVWAIALLCFSMSSTALAFDGDEKGKSHPHTSRPPKDKVADVDLTGGTGSTATAAAGTTAKTPEDTPKHSASATASAGGSGGAPALPATGAVKPEEELRERQEAITRFARARNSPLEAFLLAHDIYVRKVKRNKDGNLLNDADLYKEIFDLLCTGIKGGESRAIYNLAVLIQDNKIHQDENGVPIQDNKHRFQVVGRLYRDAHKAGHRVATYNLGVLIQENKIHEDEEGMPIEDEDDRSVALVFLYTIVNQKAGKALAAKAAGNLATLRIHDDLLTDGFSKASQYLAEIASSKASSVPAVQPPVDSAAGEAPVAAGTSAGAATNPLGTGSGAGSGAKPKKG
jgi:hypothetical protein